MRAILAAVAALIAGPALAQAPASGPALPAPSVGKVISVKEALALAAAARAAAPAGQAQVNRPLAEQAPFRLQAEHRIADTPPSVHERNAELLVVLEGEGTVTTGGTLVDPVRRGNNFTGKSISGGQTQPIAKGDFIWVPANTPHGFHSTGGELVMTALHLPVVRD